MIGFELAHPASLAEAIAMLDTDDPTVRPFSGGTALMLMMKSGVFRPTRLVSLRKLGEQYARIAANAEDRPVCYPRDAFHDAEPCVSRYSGPIIP